MKKVNDRENFHTFYVDDLNADKLLVNPNRMNFGLPIKKKVMMIILILSD